MNDLIRPSNMFPVRVARKAPAAEGITSFEFDSLDKRDLPAFTPGSHIVVSAPNGALRKYSLCGDPSDLRRYVIAVKLEAGGQGGSRSMTNDVEEGDVLNISHPDNAFELVDSAKGYLFIAGGIGITPILSMIRSFGEFPPAPWKLYYLSQRPETSAFLSLLKGPEFGSRVTVHHDHGDPGRAFDLWPVLEKPGNSHIYCCGPKGLMEAVRDMSGHWPSGRVHFESFLAGGGVQPDDKPFEVQLEKSGRTLSVPVGESILNVVRKAGIPIPFSCESGTCGTCRTRLLAGEADHRDMVLMLEELDSQIMVCVSRAKSDRLVLDL